MFLILVEPMAPEKVGCMQKPPSFRALFSFCLFVVVGLTLDSNSLKDRG